MVAVQVGATFMPLVRQLNKLVRYAAEWRDDRVEYSDCLQIVSPSWQVKWRDVVEWRRLDLT